MLKEEVWTRTIARPDIWRGLRIALPLSESGGTANVFSVYRLGNTLTTGVLAANALTNTWRAGQFGAELTGNNNWFFDDRAEMWEGNPTTLSEYSVLWAGTFDAIPSGDSPLFYLAPGGGLAWGGAQIALAFDKAVFGTSDADAIRFRSNTTGEDVYIPDLTPGPKVVVGRHSNTRAPSLFINGSNSGAVVGTNASATIPGGTNNTNLDQFRINGDGFDTFTDGGSAVVLLWDRWIDDAEVEALSADPWLPFRIPRRRTYVIPTAGGGATTQTETLSLDAALQAQRELAASIDGAIATTQSKTTSVDAALARLGTISAAVDAALQATATQSVSIDSALEAIRTATAELDAALEAGGAVAAVLDAAVAKALDESISVDAALRATRTASASLDAQLVAAGTNLLTAALDGALQASRTMTASLDAYLSDAGVNLITAALDAALQAGRSASVGIDGALQTSATAQTQLDGVIAIARTLEANIDAAVARVLSFSTSIDAALQQARTASVMLSAQIGAVATFAPAASRTFSVDPRGRVTLVVPPKSRRH